MTNTTLPRAELQAAVNTDEELWREREGDYYANSIHVTQDGKIGMNVGGTVFVMPIKAWHDAARLAQQEEKPTPWTTDSAGRITQTLKQEEKPEPVAWMCLDDPERETAFTWKNGHCKNCGKNRIPLYTAPPKRPWQGLTDEEIRNEAKNHVFDESFFSGAIWARGKMMGKNYD